VTNKKIMGIKYFTVTDYNAKIITTYRNNREFSFFSIPKD